MTKQGIMELYMYLSTAWPLVVRPGADENWKRAKMNELYRTWRDFEDMDVIEAFQKWTREQEKFPTTKNIINEIEWAHVKNRRTVDGPVAFQMERIRDDGTEFIVMHNGKVNFTWNEFLQIPCNTQHLDPEEWDRRFKARRKHILKELYGGA